MEKAKKAYVVPVLSVTGFKQNDLMWQSTEPFLGLEDFFDQGEI